MTLSANMRLVTPDMFGDLNTEKHQVVLQRMYDDVEAFGLEGAHIDAAGMWDICEEEDGPPLIIRGSHCSHRMGRFKVHQRTEVAIQIDAVHATMEGRLAVRGPGSTSYSSRKLFNGVQLLNCFSTTIGDIEVHNTVRHAVESLAQAPSTVIGLIVDRIFGKDIGSAAGTPTQSNAKLILPAVVLGHIGSASASTQRTHLAVSLSQHPGHVRQFDWCFIAGRPYQLLLVDEVGGIVHTYPKLFDQDLTNVDIEFSHGAISKTAGGNSAAYQVGLVIGQRAGIGSWDGGLYGGSRGGLEIEASGFGLILGVQGSSTRLGGNYGCVHFEACEAHIVQASRPKTTITIDSSSALDWSKCWGVTLHKDDEVSNVNWGELDGVIVADEVHYNRARIQSARNLVPAALLASNDPLRNNGDLVGNNLEIEVEYNDKLNELFGYDSFKVNLSGTFRGQGPGPVTLTPSDPAHTIGGLASKVLTGPELDVPVVLEGTFIVSDNDWRIWTTPRTEHY